MNQIFTRFMLVCLSSAMLIGCQQPKSTFSPQQIDAMRAQGFSETPQGWTLGLSERILFGNNQARLTSESLASVHRMAASLVATGLYHARIDGHTDNYGEASYNDALSFKRANVVADAWATGGNIPRSNITTQGFGQRYPVASNKSASGRAENRRVAVVITAP